MTIGTPQSGTSATQTGSLAGGGGRAPANLGDILERVLDKGLVIAGDIRVNLLDIELLTIKLRLVIASVDKAKEIGIDWWERDPALSRGSGDDDGVADRLDRIEAQLARLGGGDG